MKPDSVYVTLRRDTVSALSNAERRTPEIFTNCLSAEKWPQILCEALIRDYNMNVLYWKILKFQKITVKYIIRFDFTNQNSKAND
jgi:hypothetical protein